MQLLLVKQLLLLSSSSLRRRRRALLPDLSSSCLSLLLAMVMVMTTTFLFLVFSSCCSECRFDSESTTSNCNRFPSSSTTTTAIFNVVESFQPSLRPVKVHHRYHDNKYYREYNYHHHNSQNYNFAKATTTAQSSSSSSFFLPLRSSSFDDKGYDGKEEDDDVADDATNNEKELAAKVSKEEKEVQINHNDNNRSSSSSNVIINSNTTNGIINATTISGMHSSSSSWTSQTMELAIPALIGMLVDPLLSMMDTAYVGNIGGSRGGGSSCYELAALGACTSIFHLSFNAFRATTAATTSLVGNAKKKASSSSSATSATKYNNNSSSSSSNDDDGDDERRNIVRVSLSFGLTMGILVGSFLRKYGFWCLQTMGVPNNKNSPLFAPAISYLSTRSLAAPAVLCITVCEGAFRGYGDTKIPLKASLVAAFLNLILDPLLMLPPLSKGVQGAAAATAISQYGALFVYLFFLIRRRMILLPTRNDIQKKLMVMLRKIKRSRNRSEIESTTVSSSMSSSRGSTTATSNNNTNTMNVVKTILGANLAMICKQGSLLFGWAYATSKATRIGPEHVAAHQVALSCWLVFALLQDASGVASQVLLTRVLSNADDDDDNNDIADDDDDDVNTTNNLEKKTNRDDENKNSKRLLELRSLIRYMIRLSIVQGLVATICFLMISPFIPGWFVPRRSSSSDGVRQILKKLLPHVAGQQLLVSMTLIFESLAVGGKQFKLLAVGTTISTVFSMMQIKSATTIVGIWSKGIVSLFVGRFVTAMIGTYRVLRQQQQQSYQKEANEG